MRNQLLALSSILFGLSGCASDLSVSQIHDGDTVVGYPYRLNFTQFDVDVTWRVIGCDTANDPPLKLKITAEAKDKSAPDPSQFYVIDPRTLQGLFRATEFSMEWYEDRSIKSINSSVDDQTGAAITGVLTAAAKLAGVGLFPGIGATRTQCDEKVMAALAEIGGQEAAVKKAQREVEDQTVVVTQLTAKAVAAGDALDDKTRAALAQAQAQLEAQTAVLAAEQAKLKRPLEVLTDTKTITWPRAGGTFESEAYKPSAEAMKRWKMNSFNLGANVYLALLPRDGFALPAAVTGAEGNKPRTPPGIPYREPRQMRLYVCSPAPCGQDQQALEDSSNVVKAANALVLQGGTMFYLPFRARTFAHIKNSAGFSPAGVLTTAGSSQVRGAGTGVVETLQGSAEQISAGIVAGRAAKTAKLKAQADELAAKKALAEAQAALAPADDADKQAAIKAFTTDATLATAERTKIEAEAALAAAKAAQAVP